MKQHQLDGHIGTDPENLPVSAEEQAAVDKIYGRMDELEEINLQLGMIKDARTEIRWASICSAAFWAKRPSSVC